MGHDALFLSSMQSLLGSSQVADWHCPKAAVNTFGGFQMDRTTLDSGERELAHARALLDRRDAVKGLAGLAAALFGGVLLTQGSASALSSNQGLVILAAARRMIGTPYVWGGPQFPRNTDCSSLTQWAYAQANLRIPRVAADQFRACTYSANVPGALVFFNTTEARGAITHVGVNAGNGRFVNANSAAGRVIEEQWQGNGYWAPRFIACATF
jgi:hypothetical protein